MTEQKEAIPTIPQVQKQVVKKVDYKDASKKSPIKKIKETFPKPLIPTKRFGKILGIIFVLVLIIAGIQFPFASFMSGNMDATIDIGYPLPFLELGLQGEGDFPFLPINFILDFLIYIILAYIIDIFLKLILESQLFKSKEKIKETPAIFKNQNQTAPEKIQTTPVAS